VAGSGMWRARAVTGSCQTISRSHTHTPTENNTPDTDTHTHDKKNTPNPQTNTPHKHVTTLEGGTTTVRATSHARVGGRAEVSVGGRVEVRRGLGRARVRRAPAGTGSCEWPVPSFKKPV